MRRATVLGLLNLLVGATVAAAVTPSIAAADEEAGRCCATATNGSRYCCADCCSELDTCKKSEDCSKKDE